MDLDFEDNVKASHGQFATAIWLVGGAILFLTDDVGPGLLSSQALFFLAIGMFAAAIVVGNITFLIHKPISKRLASKLREGENREKVEKSAKQASFFLFFIDLSVALVFLLWVYNAFFWN